MAASLVAIGSTSRGRVKGSRINGLGQHAGAVDLVDVMPVAAEVNGGFARLGKSAGKGKGKGKGKGTRGGSGTGEGAGHCVDAPGAVTAKSADVEPAGQGACDRGSLQPTLEGAPSLLPLAPGVWRPALVPPEEAEGALYVTKRSWVSTVAAAVREGQRVLFGESFFVLLRVRKELRMLAGRDAGRKSGKGHVDAEREHTRAQRAQRRDEARRLLVPIDPDTGAIVAAGGPEQVGYLPVLYAGRCKDRSTALLRANDLFALNAAWQFFVNGVQYPFLPHPLHPFFGVYFTPSPVEHLQLVADWLDSRTEALQAEDARALDLGTGCGVIAFMMREKRPNLQIVASDMCPNAVFSVQNEIARWNASGIEVVQSNLFEAFSERDAFDAIVFNPPWIPRPPGEWERDSEVVIPAPNVVPGDVGAGNDYPEDLFARLFAEAPRFLKPGGKLLIVFSNYAERRGLVDQTPLQPFVENERGHGLTFRGVERRPVASKDRGKHRQTRRDKSWTLNLEQSVELWEFELLPV